MNIQTKHIETEVCLSEHVEDKNVTQREREEENLFRVWKTATSDSGVGASNGEDKYDMHKTLANGKGSDSRVGPGSLLNGNRVGFLVQNSQTLIFYKICRWSPHSL